MHLVKQHAIKVKFYKEDRIIYERKKLARDKNILGSWGINSEANLQLL